MTSKNIIVERNVPASMRDGTVLYADIYRPDQEGQFPVLLTRIPYGKHDPFYSHRYLDTHRFVDNGFIVIIQDVRGRFASEGTFSMFTNEAKDGYDTVEWAANLSFSDGNVGMFGLSYYGYTQLLAATENPPSLKAIFPAQTLNDGRRGTLYQNGAFNLALYQSLILGTFVPDLLKRKYKDDTTTYYKMMQKWADEVNNIDKWYRIKPVQQHSILEQFGLEDEFFDIISRTLDDDSYWHAISLIDKYEQINIPAFHLAGWYDCFQSSTIDNYEQLVKRGKTNQRLMIGPWAHGLFGHVIGNRSFGLQASEHFINLQEDLTDLHIRWFNQWLKGEENGFGLETDSPIQYFTMGINKWQSTNAWPPKEAKYVPFYFHSKGNANSRFGDGILQKEKDTNNFVDTFIYDPNNPVPTTGGPTLYDGIQIEGPYDQRKVEERDDVLVYSSEPLTEDVEVTGPITIKLWAQTDAKDTDFTAKLIDVFPDGTAYNLTDGIIRARYRNGNKKEADLEGQIIPYTIDLWSTSNVFQKGHQIRVEISSSSYPRFDVNPNTGDSIVTSDHMQKAKQTIYHNEEYPSHILLPIVP